MLVLFDNQTLMTIARPLAADALGSQQPALGKPIATSAALMLCEGAAFPRS